MTGVDDYPTDCDFLYNLLSLTNSESRFKQCHDTELYLRFVKDPVLFDQDELNDTFVNDVGARCMHYVQTLPNSCSRVSLC